MASSRLSSKKQFEESKQVGAWLLSSTSVAAGDCDDYGCSVASLSSLFLSSASLAALSSLKRAKANFAQVPHWVPTLVFFISSFQVQTLSSLTQRLICPSVTAWHEHMYIGVAPSSGLLG